MYKILNFVLLLCICLGFIQCSNRSDPPHPKVTSELTKEQKLLIESDNSFGFRLFKEIIKKEKDKNVFISPLSVALALGMTYNGASGRTQEAMQKTLELIDLSMEEVNKSYKGLIGLLIGLDPKVRFQIANSIWYHQDFTPQEKFINLCQRDFNALVSGLDFKDPNSANIINAWVDENTNGRITQIVDAPIDPLMVMFLINAIYFKGTWSEPFDKKLTKDDWFTLPDSSKKPCKMMIRGGGIRYLDQADFQAIDLPYGDSAFSMTIFLPHPQKNIDSLIGEFNQGNWDNWMDGFKGKRVILHLPKFTLTYELILNDILRSLGMAIAFEPSQADFTRMYKGLQPFFISEVKHKTFVEVNEEGTEAAAVTSVAMATGIPPLIRVDRPFVFVIRENRSQTILFIGKIVEPIFE
jgi:serine protease inhibitor